LQLVDPFSVAPDSPSEDRRIGGDGYFRKSPKPVPPNFIALEAGRIALERLVHAVWIITQRKEKGGTANGRS
jgi:hypothetical protein